MNELSDGIAETCAEIDERAWVQLLIYAPKRALFKALLVHKRAHKE